MDNNNVMILLPIFVAMSIFVVSIMRTSKVKRRAVGEIMGMISANKAKFKREFKLVSAGKMDELEERLREKGYDKRSRKLVKEALVRLYKMEH